MMTTNVEAITALLSTARGARRQSLASREAEEVLNIALALLVEQAVANDRIDRLERMVADLRGEDVETLRDVRYDGEIADARRAATDALLVRVMRIFLDPRAQEEEGATSSY